MSSFVEVNPLGPVQAKSNGPTPPLTVSAMVPFAVRSHSLLVTVSEVVRFSGALSVNVRLVLHPFASVIATV